MVCVGVRVSRCSKVKLQINGFVLFSIQKVVIASTKELKGTKELLAMWPLVMYFNYFEIVSLQHLVFRY